MPKAVMIGAERWTWRASVWRTDRRVAFKQAYDTAVHAGDTEVASQIVADATRRWGKSHSGLAQTA